MTKPTLIQGAKHDADAKERAKHLAHYEEYYGRHIHAYEKPEGTMLTIDRQPVLGTFFHASAAADFARAMIDKLDGRAA